MLITKENIDTPNEALAYMTECALATVEGFASRKSPPVGEFRRAVKIAQIGMDWLARFKALAQTDSRIFEVWTSSEGSVARYASDMRRRLKFKAVDLTED